MKLGFFLIFFSACLIFKLSSHKCIHDQLEVHLHRVPTSNSVPFPFGDKQMAQTSYQNIRIHADFSTLTKGSEQLREYIRNQLVPSAISFFQSTLKVRRLKDPLTLEFECADLMPPPHLMTKGIDTDLIILVTAQEFQESFVAAALPCALSMTDNRPVYGAIYFNLLYLSTASQADLEENLSTTLHEMTHVLGFASYMYQYYINPITGIPLKNHVRTKIVNEQKITYIDVEPLTTKLRKYFGCPTLEGAYLENEGSEGSAGSHWERRVFMNEYMTASTITDPKVSEITLALLEGSGWYKVDYTKVEPYSWGKGEGCSFLDGKCLNQNAIPNFDEFCSPLSRIGCTFSSRAIAVCGTIGSIATDPKLNPSIDYWGNKTVVIDSFGDNCPYYMGFRFSDCENPDNQLYSFLEAEAYGTTSRCFGGTLSTKSSKGRHLGFCFPTECQQQDVGFVVNLKVGDMNITCSRKEIITIPDLLGYLECPDPDIFCSRANPIYCERGCSGRGDCINNVCHCPEGWGGTDCGLRIYVNDCERCKGENVNNACFGDICWCNPNTHNCPGPTLIGAGGEPISEGEGSDEANYTTMDTRKVGTLIWMLVCLVILFWKNKLTRERQ